MKLQGATSIIGTIDLPGDKSISHRAAMFAAIAEGTTRIDNFSTSVDCHTTLDCLGSLGVKIERDGSTVTVVGVGTQGFREPSAAIDCGNSGTTIRLLAGILAGQQFNSVLTGDESLALRPMKRIIQPLRLMGAAIEAANDRLPIRIVGGGSLNAIEYRMPVASAQVKSCVLLAGLSAHGPTAVIETVETRDHTERMLRRLGVDVAEESHGDTRRISVDGPVHLTANNLKVPGDVSSAAFFLVAAACLPGSNILLKNVGLNPTRRGIIDVLEQFGVEIIIENQRDQCNEPVGDVRVVSSGLPSATGLRILSGDLIANIIDEIPVLAVFGTQIENGLEIRDAGELRVKESDRIGSIVENLRRMGADVEEYPDGFRVERSRLKGAVVHSFGDHRIAMAFAVAALFAEGETTINGAECADISFPGFFETLKTVVR